MKDLGLVESNLDERRETGPERGGRGPESHSNPGSGRGRNMGLPGDRGGGDGAAAGPPDPGLPQGGVGRPRYLLPAPAKPAAAAAPHPHRGTGWGSSLGVNPESATPPQESPPAHKSRQDVEGGRRAVPGTGQGSLCIHGWPWSFWHHTIQGALPGGPSCEAEDANP